MKPSQKKNVSVSPSNKGESKDIRPQLLHGHKSFYRAFLHGVYACICTYSIDREHGCMDEL